MTPRLMEVRQKVLNKNDVAARALRERFREAGVCVVSLVSSPGSGKTAFLERCSRGCGRGTVSPPWWAISRPITTPSGWRAARLRSSRSAPEPSVIWMRAWWKKRSKDGICVNSISSSSRTWAIWSARRAYDLGENARLVLHSVTEGEDKPLKYPTIFTARMLLLLPRWIWLRPSNSTRRPLTRT